MNIHAQDAFNRQYKSESSLATATSQAVLDGTRSKLANVAGRVLYATQSEPAISNRKPHPLLNDFDGGKHSYAELLFGAETLENIAAEGAYAGATMRRYRENAAKGKKEVVGREMTDRILRMVYGTMKYLPYIDTLLVKTQFLVYNNQFLNHLGLVKVMVFELMKFHFDLQAFPGVDYTSAALDESEEQRAEIVHDLEDALRQFQVKLAAAFARVRIERRASGTTTQEMLENILPEEVRAKEHLAVEMSKTVRINFLKTNKNQVAEDLRAAGFKVKLARSSDPDVNSSSSAEECISVDDMFSDFLVIPTGLFADIKGCPILTEGKLIFQDKASAYGIRHLTSLIAETDQIIDSRAGCGINSSYLASLMKNKGKLFAFESRTSRIKSLKLRLDNQRVKNVEVIEEDFVSSDATDAKFAEVTTILIEPPNSGTAIVDKLGYLLQEEEFPNDQQSQKDLTSLKRRQSNMLQHAFTFPSVRTILYMTRTLNKDENETMVNEFLEKLKGEWELNCVLPDIIVTQEHEWEIEDCLKIKPTRTGNGVFVACFTKIVISESESEPDLTATDATPAPAPTTNKKGTNNSTTTKRKKKKKSLTSFTAANSSSSIPTNVSSREYHHVRPDRTSRTIPSDKHPPPFKKMGSSGDSLNTTKLPKNLELSVNRLSVPRRPTFLHDESGDTSGGIRHTVHRTKQTKAIHRHDSKGVQDDDLLGSDNEDHANVDDALEGGGGFDEVDINIFGVSLKKFYEPRAHAVREMKIQHIQPIDTLRWRYPVPNPRPWK
ncbi:hypothetical protein HDU77_006135 [Chytriomyces hyalinus]|nr:hypothetical protein HDU77_006135 [Chytriomyces hyalinus]